MRDTLVSAKVLKYPVVSVEFEDGLTGELDMTSDIEKYPFFAELKNQELFSKVGIDSDGHRLGWKLDQIYHEIDMGSDSVRAQVETDFIRNLAKTYRKERQAAE